MNRSLKAGEGDLRGTVSSPPFLRTPPIQFVVSVKKTSTKYRLWNKGNSFQKNQKQGFYIPKMCRMKILYKNFVDNLCIDAD